MKTFHVSEQTAEDYASELVAVAEGWGDPRTSREASDFTYIVQKRLSEAKYKWRSDAERETFEAEQKLKHESYESLIRDRKRRRT